MAASAIDTRAPKKTVEEQAVIQQEFLQNQLQPALNSAAKGEIHLFFIDAAHFVFGTYLCYVWSILRLCIRAASGRQRYNVLGSWNAITRELITITNTTVVNKETMCELLMKLAAMKLTKPVTVVLDNARYQRNKTVQDLANELKIKLLYLPSYSPNLNLIERLWGFMKRTAVYGKYHANFAAFQASIEKVISEINTTHAMALATLMTPRFQTFKNKSLMTS